MAAPFIRPVPSLVLDQDERRFDAQSIDELCRRSGITLDPAMALLYCKWFVGSDYGWRSSWRSGEYQGGRKGMRFNVGQLASHLACTSSAGGAYYSLHTQCKSGTHNGQPFHWTRFLAIDLDDGRSTIQPLRDRYHRCVELFGIPLVIRSPNAGLHLYWPLTEPVSVFGFVNKGPHNLTTTIDHVLESGGLHIANGNVEVFPKYNKALRLPLGATSIQLNPSNLTPLCPGSRSEQIAVLVDTMELIARDKPLDPFALVSRIAEARTVGPRQRAPQGRARQARRGQVDVRRLLNDGLYTGVSRNHAALALARYWMIVKQMDTDETVDRLMNWTATKTNGLSKEAETIDRASTRRSLEREYRRICTNLQRAVTAGQFDQRLMFNATAHLGDHEAELVFNATNQDGLTGKESYWNEVFACCVIGFAKRYGKPARSNREDDLLLETRVQLAATMLNQWPRCAGDGYQKRIKWATKSKILRLVRSHRPPRGGLPGEARTYAVRTERDSVSPIQINGPTLLEALTLLKAGWYRRLHPQQIEHALLAHRRCGNKLSKRYGKCLAQRIREMCAAYEAASKRKRAA